MSDRSKVDDVMSGIPYVVTLVNGRPPESLNDFVTDDVVAITVAAAEQVVTVTAQCGATATQLSFTRKTTTESAKM